MEKSKFKNFLSLFLMLFVLGFTTNISAQSLTDATAVKSSSDMAVFENSATAQDDLLQEITTLRGSLQLMTSGSAAAVDATRRVEVFSTSLKSLRSGKTPYEAYTTGLQAIKGIDAKESAQAQLDLIKDRLFDLLTD